MSKGKTIIHTELGPIESPAVIKAAIAGIPCEGDACPNMLSKFSGRVVVLVNRSEDTVSGQIEWGSVFGCDPHYTLFTLFPGEKESYPFPSSGTLGVCKIVANIE